MDETYDVVVLGTNVTQSLITALLSIQGLNVLQVDRNNFYGGQEANLNWQQLCKWFGQEEENEGRLWNVDIVPLLLEAQLLAIFDSMKISTYVEYVGLQGTFVVQDSQLHQLSHYSDWLLSPDFRALLAGFDSTNTDTWGGLDLTNLSFAEVTAHFSLRVGETLGNFSGVQGLELIKQSQTYIYADYGAISVVEACSRLSAVYGGTVMLGQTVEFEWEGDKITGVRLAGRTVRCSNVVSDAAYVLEHTQKRSTVVRAICVLRHPVGTVSSGLVIVPRETHSIYITVLSALQHICPAGYWVAVCRTEAETETPEDELKPAYDVLQPIERTFFSKTEVVEATPCENLWVTQSPSAAPHARQVAEEVKFIVSCVTAVTLT